MLLREFQPPSSERASAGRGLSVRTSVVGMPKKLKVFVKSLYSHEIRKDVSLTDLHSLKLEEAWPFIRDEIAAEIGSLGSSQLACIPHVTEAELYSVTSLFIQEQEGSPLRPLGQLQDFIDMERSDDALVQSLSEHTAIDPNFKFCHESVKITLQDETIKNKVRVIMVNFSRELAHPSLMGESLPPLYLRSDKVNAENGGVVYCVTSALRVGTLEFRVTRGTSSRIFHLGNPTPLLFALHRFSMDKDMKLYSAGPVSTKTHNVRWQRMDSADHLYTTDTDNAALYQ